MLKRLISAVRRPALPVPQGEPADDLITDDPRQTLTIGFVTLALFFVVLLGWGGFARLDSAVIASGQVQVDGYRKVVQHQDGGTVTDILVKEGEVVEKGQLLVRLDDMQTRAVVNLIADQYYSGLAMEARLKAERGGASAVVFPPELTAHRTSPEVADAIASQQNLFQSRKRSLDGQISVLRQRISQLRQQAEGARVQQRAQEQQLVLIEDELKGARELNQKGYMPLNRVRALERAAAQLGGQLGQYRSSAASLQQAIGETEMQILQLQKERASEINAALSDTQDKVFALAERLRAAEYSLEKTQVVAPSAGKVLNLRATTVGGVIGRGEIICEIVPQDGFLLVEAMVRPEDIEDMTVGAFAEVRLTSYKAREVPPLPGVVSLVSADRITDERTRVAYYKVNVEVDSSVIEQMKGVKMVAGMPAEVIIPTGERTAINYIMQPLFQGFRHALREK